MFEPKRDEPINKLIFLLHMKCVLVCFIWKWAQSWIELDQKSERKLMETEPNLSRDLDQKCARNVPDS